MYPWLLFLLIGGVFTIVVGTVVVIVGLRRAPIAKEDETGFHILEESDSRRAASTPASIAQITS